ncbi:unnamed protein product, partial [Pylaiella littoralis]
MQQNFTPALELRQRDEVEPQTGNDSNIFEGIYHIVPPAVKAHVQIPEKRNFQALTVRHLHILLCRQRLTTIVHVFPVVHPRNCRAGVTEEHRRARRKVGNLHGQDRNDGIREHGRTWRTAVAAQAGISHTGVAQTARVVGVAVNTTTKTKTFKTAFRGAVFLFVPEPTTP